MLSDGFVNHQVAMTMAFLTLALIQLFHSYNSRSQRHSLFSSNPFKNKVLNWSFVAGVALTALTFIPALQTFFGTTMLSATEFAIAIGCAVAIIPVVEFQKAIEHCVWKNKKQKIADFNKEEEKEVESQN